MSSWIVSGACPYCGAPIYIPGRHEGSSPPLAAYSCVCREVIQRKMTQPDITTASTPINTIYADGTDTSLLIPEKHAGNA